MSLSRRVWAACAAVFALGVVGPSASYATFHLMQIEQVIGGVNGDATAQAVQLRMRAVFQEELQFARLRVWDAAGANPILLIDFTTPVSMRASGSRILVASPGFVASTNPNAMPDYVFTSLIPTSYLAAGSLTYEDDAGTVLWRLSWGGASYTGSTLGDSTNDDDPGFGPADYGPPFPGPLPSTSLQALRFTGPANALSTTNAADYAVTDAAATFVNNAGDSFVVIAPPSPVGDVDGDGDVDLADFALCVPCLGGPDDPTAPAECSAAHFSACDFDGDGDVDLEDFAAFQAGFTGTR